MLEILKLLTSAWLALWALNGIVGLSRGRRSSILALYVIHFAFCGLPILLDVLIGQPTYRRFPGFVLATQDSEVVILYCVYVSLTPIIWWLVGRGAPQSEGEPTVSEIVLPAATSGWLAAVPYIFLISPLIALAFAPNPAIYLTYGWVAGDLDPG